MAFIKECCSSFFAGLPDPALPLIPSLLLGLAFAALFLMIVYKKQTKMSLKDIFSDMVKSVFCLLPSHEPEHSAMTSCQNPSCVRCNKSKDLQGRAIKKYDEIKSKQTKVINSRIEDGIRAVKEKCHPSLRSNIEDSKSEGPKNPVRNSLQKPTIFSMDLAANPFWNDFDVYSLELELLKINFKIILGEFQEVFEKFKSGTNAGWKLNDIATGHWCIYPFIDQGIVNDANCRRCPNTATMIGSLPSVMKDCVFGNASFSILYPDSHIEPHYGPTNLRLRCHLGLSIPSGCWLEVAGKQHKWKSQQTVVFDESFEHSATFTNKASYEHASPRAILMVDFWHPDVSADEKKVLEELFAP